MDLIIYRKSDGQPLLQETISSLFTKETNDSTFNYQHVAKNHGGTKEDYAEVWIEDDEIIKKTTTYEFTVVNGEIVFGAEKVIDEPPKEPTPIDTMTDYLVDVDYSLTLVELGLNQ